MPETLEEGRTIVRNLRRSSKLFLVKNVYSLILIVVYAAGLLGLPFPYVPQQVTLLNWLVIGIPAFVIAMSRERAPTAGRPHFLREVGWFAVRTGILFAVAGIAALIIAGRLHRPEIGPAASRQEVRREIRDLRMTQRTVLLSVLIVLGVTALLRALKDGEEGKVAGDTRFRLLAMLAIPAFLLAMYWPMAARFFELVPLDGLDWLIIVGLTGAAYLATIASDTWRASVIPASRAP